MWGMTRTESQSSSILPKRRMKHKQIEIKDSVLQSRNESSRLADLLSNQNSTLAPSIRKALKERANFYRRKLTFYENLGIMAVSMTSTELQDKLNEAKTDLNSSHATSNLNQLLNQRNNLSSHQGKRNTILSQTGSHIDVVKEQANEENKLNSTEQLPMLSDTPD